MARRCVSRSESTPKSTGQFVQLVLALSVASAVARGRAAIVEFVACTAGGAVLCARPEGEGMGSSTCVVSTSPMPDHERSGELY